MNDWASRSGITHVVRGDDHIANTPKQILLYEAMGHTAPEFAHIPLILGPDKKKLSKRHGGNTMKDFLDEGFLPISSFNFLSLLGWNPGDDRELMTIDEIIEAFSFNGIGKSAAVFDRDKLEWLNKNWVSKLSFEELLPFLKQEMESFGTWNEPLLSDRRQWFETIVELMKERSWKVSTLASDSRFFFFDPTEYNEKAVKKFCKAPELPEYLGKFVSNLGEVESWKAEQLETCLRETAEELELGAGKLIHPMRIGMTGLGVTPDLFVIGEMLGKESVLKRLENFAEFLKNR